MILEYPTFNSNNNLCNQIIRKLFQAIIVSALDENMLIWISRVNAKKHETVTSTCLIKFWKLVFIFTFSGKMFISSCQFLLNQNFMHWHKNQHWDKIIQVLSSLATVHDLHSYSAGKKLKDKKPTSTYILCFYVRKIVVAFYSTHKRKNIIFFSFSRSLSSLWLRIF